MPRKEKKYHYIYKTTCKVNGKYYVGMHSTDNLDDGYIGSGKRLWNSIRKHGNENFEVEFLEFFETRKALIDREIEMVNEDMLQDPMCMNLRIGGTGGIINEEHHKKMREGASKFAKALWKDHDFRLKKKELDSIMWKELHRQGKFRHDTFKDKKHTEETKNKIRNKAKLRTGNKNSQYGTCWVYKLDILGIPENKKIKLCDLNVWLDNGWHKGRKITK